MKIVKVKGGAGNQLFQASHVYASLRSADEKVVLVSHRLQKDSTKRDFFTPAWSLFNAKDRSGLGLKLLLKLSKIPVFAAFLERLDITCIDGYFQEGIHMGYAGYVKRAISEIAGEGAGVYAGAIHCRGGDYLLPPNDEIYAKLSIADYDRAINSEDLSEGWAVLGNHETLIPQLEDTGAIQVNGSICEDLATMGRAKKVVCSNSTFAFWGAAFCLLGGGKVAVPKSYYIDSDGSNPFDVLVREFPDQVTQFEVDNA